MLRHYDLYHNIDKQGRGVCIYTHKTLNAKPFISLGTNFQESIWVEIKLNKKDTFLIGCVYKSPGSSGTNNEQLNELISELMRYKHSHLLLLGDFNYPNIDWQNWYTLSENTNNPDTKFKEGIRDNFLFQNVTLPTRGRFGNKLNILDLVFTNEKGMIDDIVYESPLGKSDHSVLIITFRCYAEIASHTRLKYYYDQGDYNSMKMKLDYTDWGKILGMSTINHQWLGFKEYIKKIEDEFIPHRLVSNINRHKGKVPLNKESVNKIKKKHTLWKRYMETKEGKYYTEYCRARNQVRKLKRTIQKEFEMKLATEAKTNPKAVWKYMNSKTKNREGVSDLNIDPKDPKSRLTDSDSVFTIEPDGDIPHISPVKLRHNKEELTIDEEMIKKT